jgi:MYXO-CTERM domain-containing protein
MKNQKLVALASLAISASAFAGVPAYTQSFGDAQNDLFDNGFGNLDITNVDVTYQAGSLRFDVSTRAFSSWTKYCLFISAGSGASTESNPWNRPHSTNGQTITHFLGSWVDQASDNVQHWSFGSSGWSYVATGTNSHASGNTVSFWLDGIYLAEGDSIRFDVGTSGGGNDPMVDLLSRSNPSTSGWGSASTSGNFLTFTIPGVPAPGAIALLGVAGLVSRRRRA